MYDSQSGFGGSGGQGRQMGGNNMGRSYQVSLILSIKCVNSTL